MYNTIEQDKINTYMVNSIDCKEGIFYMPQNYNIYYWYLEYTN